MEVHIEEAYTLLSDHLMQGYNHPLTIDYLTYEASKQLEEDGYKLTFIDSEYSPIGYLILFN